MANKPSAATKYDDAAVLSHENVAEEARNALAKATNALQGAALARSLQAMTFEEAVDAYIQSVEGPSTQVRPNKLDRIARVASGVTKTAEILKETDDSSWLDDDDIDYSNVNDPEEE
jgi:hypothetical protein